MLLTMTLAPETTPVWIVPKRDLLAERALASQLGVPPIVAAVLVNRGFTDPTEADRFLHPSLEHLHDPTLLPDFAPAVKAILGARERQETIYIHGDYDVDGVTSAALLTRFLGRIGCEVIPHVPHRLREGYGIHLDAVEWAREKGASLFLTCDCGISAHEQVLAAKEAGMTVVVTDHHQVGDTLPDAVAVVNPHRPDSRYPWPELSGVGVVFKLCAGITAELGHRVEQFYRAYLDLAVLGTVADVMPLLDENRIITHFGLTTLRETKKTGLQALLRVADLATKPQLTARNIGFQLGPRINAVGRIDDSAIALDLLLTEDEIQANLIASRLDTINNDRRAEQSRSVDEAVAQVEQEGLESNYTLVLANQSWHPGVIGLVAGRLVERFRRPAFVLSVADGVAKGSARSIPGFDLGEAVRATRHLTLGGGGHEMAAGFSLKTDKLPAFTSAIEELARATLKPDDFRPRIELDAEVAAHEASPEVWADLQRLEPYGNANPEPVFAVRGVRLVGLNPTSNPDHARVTFGTEAGMMPGMAFGIGRRLAELDPGDPVDVAFSLEENRYNGQSTIRWQVKEVQKVSL